MLPCSEVHWKILPSVLRELAKDMEKEGAKNMQIASALGLTPSAVSQYKSGKRGAGKLPQGAVGLCARLAKRIAAGSVSGLRLDTEITKIVVVAKGSRLGKEDPCMVCAAGK